MIKIYEMKSVEKEIIRNIFQIKNYFRYLIDEKCIATLFPSKRIELPCSLALIITSFVDAASY